ncbi:MAG: efflux RND transporter periplasmic adaptor subunit [Pseudomonadota bacterium]
MKKVLLIPGAIVLGFVGIAATLIVTAEELEPSAPEPVPLSVRVIEVEPERVTLTVRSQGTVEPARETQIIPEVSGRVEWLSPNFAPGGRFEAKEPLLRIAAGDYTNNAARARASVQRTEAELENARFEHERLTELAKRQLVATSQLEAALRTLRVARAAHDEALVSFKQAQLDLERTTLRAPFDGLLERENVDLGQFVARGNAIADFYSESDVEVRLPLADRQLAFLDLPLGARGTLADAVRPLATIAASYGGTELNWTARITRTEAAIDRTSRMLYLVARLDASRGPIAPTAGLFVNATIEGRTVEGVYVLPRSALRENNRVITVDAENRLRFRTITPLRIEDELLLVEDGLDPGDRVCVSQIQTVVEGMRVLPISDPEPLTLARSFGAR